MIHPGVYIYPRDAIYLLPRGNYTNVAELQNLTRWKNIKVYRGLISITLEGNLILFVQI